MEMKEERMIMLIKYYKFYKISTMIENWTGLCVCLSSVRLTYAFVPLELSGD